MTDAEGLMQHGSDATLQKSRSVASLPCCIKPSASVMPARKQFQTSLKPSPELQQLMENARKRKVSEGELQEQRISFAFGNAPESSRITKDSVRHASKHIRLK